MKNGISKLFKKTTEGGPEVDRVEKQIRAAAIAEGFLGEAVDRRQYWLTEAWPSLGPIVVAFGAASPARLLLLLFVLAETIGHEASALAMAHLWNSVKAWPWLGSRLSLAALHEGDFETPDHRATWLLYRAIRETEAGDDGRPMAAFGAAVASLMEAEALGELMLVMADTNEVDEPTARGRALARALRRLVEALGQIRQIDPWQEPGVLVGVRALVRKVDPAQATLEGPAAIQWIEALVPAGRAAELVSEETPLEVPDESTVWGAEGQGKEVAHG